MTLAKLQSASEIRNLNGVRVPVKLVSPVVVGKLETCWRPAACCARGVCIFVAVVGRHKERRRDVDPREREQVRARARSQFDGTSTAKRTSCALAYDNEQTFVASRTN